MKSMKALFLVVLFAVPFSAEARPFVCRGEVHEDSPAGGIKFLALKGNLIGGWIKNAVAGAKIENDSEVPETVLGRASQLDKDASYRPRQYRNHIRFDLSKLTEVKEFGSFAPGDLCQISVMMPENAESLNTFWAPVTLNCDQSGGKMALECKMQ